MTVFSGFLRTADKCLVFKATTREVNCEQATLSHHDALRRVRPALALLAAAWLAGCGSGLRGTYSDRMGAMQYRFKSGGNVSVVVMGIETELKYQVEGKHVTIISPKGNQILDLLDDGTLEGPLGMRLAKQE